MKEKRGFTLIELLAVIVILAVIALIAVPMVLNVIDTARKESFERTLENIVYSAELYQAKLYMDNDSSECVYFSFGYPNGITVESDG